MLADLDGDGLAELVHWTTNSDATLRAVRMSDGSRFWQRTIGKASDAMPINDLMIGDTSADGQLDVVYSLYSLSGGALRINSASGGSGARLWSKDFETVVAGSGRGVGSLFDRDQDGAVDVLATPNNFLQWLDGRTGSAGPSVDAGFASYGIVANLDDDPVPEIMASGPLYGVSSFELDLTQSWKSLDTKHLRIHGAVVSCPTGERVYVSGHNASPRLTSWNGTTGAVVGDVALRGGRMWTPADVPEGLGQLASLIISPNHQSKPHRRRQAGCSYPVLGWVLICGGAMHNAARLGAQSYVSRWRSDPRGHGWRQ